MKKEIAKREFSDIKTVDFDNVKRNLEFLSCLPIMYLETDVRKFLFIVLYTFEKETENVIDIKDDTTKVYLGRNFRKNLY